MSKVVEIVPATQLEQQIVSPRIPQTLTLILKSGVSPISHVIKIYKASVQYFKILCLGMSLYEIQNRTNLPQLKLNRVVLTC